MNDWMNEEIKVVFILRHLLFSWVMAMLLKDAAEFQRNGNFYTHFQKINLAQKSSKNFK